MANTFLRTDNQTKRIVSIAFSTEQDTDPDLSFLGEYKSQPGSADKTVDRKKRGDQERGEYQYFIAAMSGKETGNKKSVSQDYKRMEDYNRGDWWMCFCIAKATISINGIMQRVTSGGLAGVESDADKSYFNEIKEEQLDELKDVLVSMGFPTTEIDKAIADAKD